MQAFESKDICSYGSRRQKEGSGGQAGTDFQKIYRRKRLGESGQKGSFPGGVKPEGTWWEGVLPGVALSGGSNKRRIGREEDRMLDYEEELKKFQPSLEVQDIEEAVYQEDLTDMSDILREMIEQTNK